MTQVVLLSSMVLKNSCISTSQITGVFFGQSFHANGTKLYSARVIPFKGSWIGATDINSVMYAYIDRKKKLPVTTLLELLVMSMIKIF